MQNARIPASDNRNRMTGIVVINPTSIKFRILNQYMTNANWFKIRIWGWLRDCRLAIFANWHKRMNETKFLMDFRWILLLFFLIPSPSIPFERFVCLVFEWPDSPWLVINGPNKRAATHLIWQRCLLSLLQHPTMKLNWIELKLITTFLSHLILDLKWFSAANSFAYSGKMTESHLHITKLRSFGQIQPDEFGLICIFRGEEEGVTLSLTFPGRWRS